ncbi:MULTISPECIES: hypothetical protein [Lacticaseibacillus]|nr:MULTISPECIES: hypothetical protein [Lacticaseibacillus]
MNNMINLSNYKVLNNESLNKVLGGKKKETWYEAIGDGVVSTFQGSLDAF